MIGKIRRKLILVAVVSVTLVLAVILLTVNLINFRRCASYADDVLDLLYENGGRFPLPDRGDSRGQPGGDAEGAPQSPGGGEAKPFPGGMNAETPYETRCFTVRYTASGADADVRNIAAVTSEEAIALADAVRAGGKSRGYTGIYRYLSADDGAFVLFVDCARQLDTARGFLVTSAAISAIGLLAVFGISMLLSGLAVRPIAEGYARQKRFVTDASHELKTPLTIISANNELIELTAGETQETRTIARQVQRMTDLVKNMTALSALDETARLRERHVFSLTDTLRDLCGIFSPAVEGGGRTFAVAVDPELFLSGDETLIRQAFSVLLDNAGKYAVSRVALSARRAGRQIVVETENDAVGIVPGNRDDCFARFYRTAEARASTVSGTGIGLSIAREIVHLHGGTIHALGTEGGGFRVTVTLPAAPQTPHAQP